jgi:hypothetical protein
MQDEVVASARDRNRVVLDRTEPAEHLEHRTGSAVERACWCERVARGEETAGGLPRDVHGRHAIGLAGDA